MLRVDHVLPNISKLSSGLPQSVFAICNGLSDVGVNVKLHTLDGHPQLPPMRFEHKSYPWHNFPFRALGRSPEMLVALKNVAKNANIIHNHNLWMLPNVYPGRAVRNTHCKLVCTVHGCFTPFSMQRSHWKKVLMWHYGQGAMLHRIDLFHATSIEEVDDIRRMGFRQPIAMITLGVEIPDVLCIDKPSTRGGRRTLLYLSRINPEKHIELLIEAWTALEYEFPDWDLKIYGPDVGEYPESIKAMVAQLRLRRVSFCGEVSGAAKDRVYREADLFILPTRTENFGLVVAESLACGTPVIVTEGAPWQELNTHQCGWWVKEDVVGVRNALTCAMKMTSDELSNMGMKGREWMAREFCWSEIGAKLADSYRWICFGGVKPGCVYTD